MKWVPCSLCAVIVGTAAPAQSVTPSPHSAVDLLVRVRAANGAHSAGMIFGVRGDSVFVITTKHTVRDTQNVKVQVTRNDTVHGGDVRWVDPSRDFAIIAFPVRDIQGTWSIPRFVQPRSATLYSGVPLYAIGCVPDCWWPPRQARYGYFQTTTYSQGSNSYEEHEIFFRSDYLEAGFSGGPLVDRDGAVMGLITTTGGATGRAIWWADLREKLKELGYSVNLQAQRGLRGRSGFVRVAGDLLPLPGRDSDGGRLLRGGRIEAGASLAGSHELVIGFDRVGFEGRKIYPGPETHAQQDVFILHNLSLGYRYRSKLPVARVQQPHSFSVGWDLLLPVGGWSITTISGDSIDVRTGEPVQRLQSLNLKRYGASASFRTDLRLYVSEKMGLSVEPALLFPNLRDVPGILLRLSIGVDYRWGM